MSRPERGRVAESSNQSYPSDIKLYGRAIHRRWCQPTRSKAFYKDPLNFFTACSRHRPSVDLPKVAIAMFSRDGRSAGRSAGRDEK